MTNLVILSRDADAYADLFKQANLTGLTLLQSVESAAQVTCQQHIEVILGDPGLCAALVAECPNLSWLQSTWAGVKPLIDLDRRDYKLTGVKEVFGPQMCEYVFAYLLYFCRRIDDYQKLQQQHSWQPLPCASLSGKTIGIVGVGSIGSAVAKMAKQFNMQVRGLCRSQHPVNYVDRVYTQQQKQDFAQGIDYLVTLLPHTRHTEGFIDAEFLGWLAPHCVLINAGRGQTVVQDALHQALLSKKLKAAVLDVFEQEPLPSAHIFWETPNLHITQHTSAVSHSSDIWAVFVNNYHRFRADTALQYVVDWQAEY